MTFPKLFPKIFPDEFPGNIGNKMSVSVPWYNTGNTPDPLAIWQAKGAASLAASYVNLVNPGTHDLTVGVAPTLDSYGWVSGSGTAYLVSDIVPTLSYTMIARVIATAAVQAFIGCQTSATQRFYFRNTIATVEYYRGSAAAASTAPSITVDTVYAVADVNTYRNGSPEAVSAGGGANPTHPIMVMGYNLAGAVASRMLTGTKMAAAAVWNTILTPQQVLDVSTALAAL